MSEIIVVTHTGHHENEILIGICTIQTLKSLLSKHFDRKKHCVKDRHKCNAYHFTKIEVNKLQVDITQSTLFPPCGSDTSENTDFQTSLSSNDAEEYINSDIIEPSEFYEMKMEKD